MTIEELKQYIDEQRKQTAWNEWRQGFNSAMNDIFEKLEKIKIKY